MVRENPKENDQPEAGSYDDQPLVIHKDAGDTDLAFHKGLERVEGTDKPFETGNPLHSQAFENDQAHGKGGDDLGRGHAPQADEHKTVDEKPDNRSDGKGKDDRKGIVQLEIIHKTPGQEPDKDIDGSVGKIGNTGHAVNQSEPHGNEGEDDAVDGTVDEYVHGT